MAKQKFKPVIVTRLEYERRRRGLSKSKLAELANMNQATVGSIESCRLVGYQVQLEKLGKAMGLPKDIWPKLQENLLDAWE